MKPNQFKQKNQSLRVGLFVISILIGIIFPLIFILTAILGFSLYMDFFGNPGGEGKHEKLKHLSVEDNQWLDEFFSVCESPAETGFLQSMVSEFSLKPENGLLVGSGVKLALQVEVSRYRLDFLVDDRLIVEIDGAAYHSSPEARKRDKERDKFFLSEGYEILRIPAKYPLYSPSEGVARVKRAQAALEAQNEKKATEIRQSFRPSRVGAALSDGFASFSDGLSKMTTEIHLKAEEQKELDRIKVEVETEERRIRIQEELADPEREKKFEETKKMFE